MYPVAYFAYLQHSFEKVGFKNKAATVNPLHLLQTTPTSRCVTRTTSSHRCPSWSARSPMRVPNRQNHELLTTVPRRRRRIRSPPPAINATTHSSSCQSMAHDYLFSIVRSSQTIYTRYPLRMWTFRKYQLNWVPFGKCARCNVWRWISTICTLCTKLTPCRWSAVSRSSQWERIAEALNSKTVYREMCSNPLVPKKKKKKEAKEVVGRHTQIQFVGFRCTGSRSLICFCFRIVDFFYRINVYTGPGISQI